MSKKKNGDVFAELTVGLFMAVVFALLVYFTVVISGVDILTGRDRIRSTVVFSDVGGLKTRDSVIYRGMKVGSVADIDLGSTNVTVVLEIDRDVVLRKSYRISVAALSLLGGNYLLLEEGTGDKMPLETSTFHGEPPSDWMRDLGDIARNVNEITSGGEIKGVLTNLEEAAKNANLIVSRIERGEGTLGKLASSDSTVYDDLKRTMSNAAEVSDRLAAGKGTLGKLTSDDSTLYDDLKRTMANVADISDRLAAGEGTLGKLMATNDVLYSEIRLAVGDLREALAGFKDFSSGLNNPTGLVGRLTKDGVLADDATAFVHDLRSVASNLVSVSENLAAGRGTLGKIMTDQKLYDEINGLLKDVRQVIDNYRDTTPITSFGSLVGGAL